MEEGARGGADDVDAMALARRGQPEADAAALQRYLDGGASLSSGLLLLLILLSCPFVII